MTEVPQGVQMVDTFKGQTGTRSFHSGHQGDPINVCLLHGVEEVLFPAVYNPTQREIVSQPRFGPSGPLPVCDIEDDCASCVIRHEVEALK